MALRRGPVLVKRLPWPNLHVPAMLSDGSLVGRGALPEGAPRIFDWKSGTFYPGSRWFRPVEGEFFGNCFAVLGVDGSTVLIGGRVSNGHEDFLHSISLVRIGGEGSTRTLFLPPGLRLPVINGFRETDHGGILFGLCKVSSYDLRERTRLRAEPLIPFLWDLAEARKHQSDHNAFRLLTEFPGAEVKAVNRHLSCVVQMRDDGALYYIRGAGELRPIDNLCSLKGRPRLTDNGVLIGTGILGEDPERVTFLRWDGRYAQRLGPQSWRAAHMSACRDDGSFVLGSADTGGARAAVMYEGDSFRAIQSITHGFETGERLRFAYGITDDDKILCRLQGPDPCTYELVVLRYLY